MKAQKVVVLSRSACPRQSSSQGLQGVPPFFVRRRWKHKMQTPHFPHFPFAIVLFTVVWIGLGQRTLAHYTSNQTGNDISYPQCSTNDAPQSAFGVVGVTGGKSFTGNPCLSKEVSWAQQQSSPVSLYMNLNAPVGSTASLAMTGPYGHCTEDDNRCQAKNYGYGAAQYAFNYAANQNVSSRMWWLDVESANSWSSDTSLNRKTIDGAFRFLHGQKGIAVGIYSTPNMWRDITNNYTDHLPVWFPAGMLPPSTYCASAYSFTGGPVYLVQYISDGLDTDYAC